MGSVAMRRRFIFIVAVILAALMSFSAPSFAQQDGYDHTWAPNEPMAVPLSNDSCLTKLVSQSACSASCGGGTMVLSYADNCGNTSSTTEACNTQACAQDAPAPRLNGDAQRERPLTVRRQAIASFGTAREPMAAPLLVNAAMVFRRSAIVADLNGLASTDLPQAARSLITPRIGTARASTAAVLQRNARLQSRRPVNAAEMNGLAM